MVPKKKKRVPELKLIFSHIKCCQTIVIASIRVFWIIRNVYGVSALVHRLLPVCTVHSVDPHTVYCTHTHKHIFLRSILANYLKTHDRLCIVCSDVWMCLRAHFTFTCRAYTAARARRGIHSHSHRCTTSKRKLQPPHRHHHQHEQVRNNNRVMCINLWVSECECIVLAFLAFSLHFCSHFFILLRFRIRWFV